MQDVYNQKVGVDLKTNFMSYPQNYININTREGIEKLQQTYKNPGSATVGQINAIIRYYNSGVLNKNDK